MNRVIFRISCAILALTVVGCATKGGGSRVSDPAGRFSFAVGEELTPKAETDGFYRYRMEKEAIDVYIVSRQADLEEKGVEEALRDAGLQPDRLIMNGSSGFGDWHARLYRQDGADLNVALAWQARGGTVYALVVTGSAAAMPGEPPAAVMRVLGSLQFTKAAGNISLPGTREELEAYMRRAAEARGGSISLAATRDGRIVYRYATGSSGIGSTATPEVAYHYGSMTKLVTAVAVMKLVESKAVDLDAPVAQYIPEFPSAFGITVRNLLTHSSGLPDREATHLVAYGEETMPALNEVLMRYLADLHKLDFAPGTSSAYSNWNYLVLGVLVERVARMPYESFVTQFILRPLGMEHTAFRHADEPAGTSVASPVISAEREPALLAVLSANRTALDAEKIAVARSGGRTYLTAFDILAPWGGLVGPADELTRFLDLHLGTAPVAGSQVLSSKTLSSMRQVQRARDGRPLGWALGWVVRKEKGETVAEHAGGGPGIDCLMRIYPDRRLGIVVMGNVNDYGVARIISAAAAILSKEAR